MSTYHVTVRGKTYTVEVPDPYARPVRTIVNGEVVDVVVPVTAQHAHTGVAGTAATMMTATTTGAASASGAVTAPLPGTVVEISVAEGDRVEMGQQLCVLEAMKMNNPIRATQAGIVRQIAISVGQQIQHNFVMMMIEN